MEYKHFLNFSYFNARSIVNKLSELQSFLSPSFNFIAISESWLHPDISNSIISAYSPNYDIFRADRMDRRAGGVALLSSQSVHAQFTCEINVTGIESVWCMFITNTDCANNPIYIGTVYRSPTCSFDNLKLWCESVHNYFFTNSQLPKLIILGDFNLPHFDWAIPCIICNELSHSFLLSFLHEHSLSQLNLTPTRNSNILDLVLTNIPDRITNLSVNPPFSTSDHDSLSLSLGTYLQQSNTDRQNVLDSVFDYKRADFLSMKLALQSTNWQDLLASDNINNIWQIFCHTLLDIVSMHCPRKHHLNRNSNNRLPHNILNLIRSKHRSLQSKCL